MKMITREFTTLHINVLVYDRETRSNTEMPWVLLPTTKYSTAQLERAVQREMGERYKVIELLNVEERKELKGMDISKFYLNAVTLDKQRRAITNEKD